MLSSIRKMLLIAVALLALCLLAAYIVVGLPDGTGTANVTTDTAAERPQAGPARQPALESAADANPATVLAFHATVPLAKRRRILVDLAEAGNAAASCYLGISLTKCSRSVHLRQHARALEKQAATMVAGSSEEEDAIDRLIAVNRSIESLKAFCGVELPASNQVAFDYLVEAAERGSESASIFLATSPPLDSDTPLAEIEHWAEYKTIVPQVLDAAARSGSLTAMYLALGIYSGTDSIVAGGGRFVEPDLTRALAYATVLAARTDHAGLRRRFEATIEQLRAQAGAIQRKRAGRLAASLLDRQFPPGSRIVSLADVSAPREPADCISRH